LTYEGTIRPPAKLICAALIWEMSFNIPHVSGP
jgi:hypothetical protein